MVDEKESSESSRWSSNKALNNQWHYLLHPEKEPQKGRKYFWRKVGAQNRAHIQDFLSYEKGQRKRQGTHYTNRFGL